MREREEEGDHVRKREPGSKVRAGENDENKLRWMNVGRVWSRGGDQENIEQLLILITSDHLKQLVTVN